MVRKIKKNKEEIKIIEKQVEQDIEKIETLLKNNYSYYVLISCIEDFIKITKSYFSLNKQIQNNNIKSINSGLIDFNHKEWIELITRTHNFMLRKYKGNKEHFDFKVMEFKKTTLATKITVEGHLKDFVEKYDYVIKDINPKFDKNNELKKAFDVLFIIMALFNAMTECITHKTLQMDKNEIKNVKTILTKYKKYILPNILSILKDGY